MLGEEDIMNCDPTKAVECSSIFQQLQYALIISPEALHPTRFLVFQFKNRPRRQLKILDNTAMCSEQGYFRLRQEHRLCARKSHENNSWIRQNGLPSLSGGP